MKAPNPPLPEITLFTLTFLRTCVDGLYFLISGFPHSGQLRWLQGNPA
jgi:hypothetical protein